MNESIQLATMVGLKIKFLLFLQVRDFEDENFFRAANIRKWKDWKEDDGDFVKSAD